MSRARRVTLLERDALFGQLAELVDSARRGSGAMALLGGEAGAGKTVLMRAFADSVAAGTDTWVGHCDPLSTPRPLSPLLDIASAPERGLRAEMATRDPYELFGQLLARLRDPARPVVVVIEDAHWADDATLDLLRFLGRRIGTARAVVVVTYRDDEVGADHPLRAVIGELSSQPATVRLHVDALSPDAVRTLATAADADLDPDALHAATGGNAFYVTEVLASGSAVPTSIQDVVRSRLLRLDADARAVVEAVATAPRELDRRYLQPLTGVAPTAVEQAVDSGVILITGSSLHFRHELARLATAHSTPESRRVEFHASMLALLAEEQSEDHALLAHHAKYAGLGELVLRHAVPAAREASARGAHRQAVDLYADAAVYAELLDEAEQVELFGTYSFELYLVDRQDESLTQARRAEAIAAASGDEQLLGRAWMWVGRGLWNTGDSRRGRALVEDAAAMLERGGPSTRLAEALYLASIQAMLARHHGQAMERGERALEMAEAVDSPYLVGRSLIAVGTAELVTGDADRGIELLDRARRLGVEHGDDRIVTSALGMLGSGGGEVRRYERAFSWLSASIKFARSHDHDSTAAYDQAWQARIRFEQGRWDEAADLARDPAAAPADAARISPLTALGVLGRVRVRRGDPDAEEPLRVALTLAADAELQHRWPSLCGLAELYWLQQRPQLAVDVLSEPYAAALDTDSAWARGEIGYWMWRTGGIDGPAPGAASPFAAMMSGDWRAAADEWRAIGCPYEEALALAEGDDEAMLAGLAIFDRLGARPAGKWLRSRLRDRGLEAIPRGPRPATKANVAGLTSRQAEVLALVCAGLPNAEIASRLYISKKTVEHHVAAILNKLEVGTRGEAIVAARRLEGGDPVRSTAE